MDREAVLAAVRKTLAADLACDEQDLCTPGLTIVEAKRVAGRRRFPFRERSLSVVSMGAGVVVSCSRERIQRVSAALNGLDRDAVFTGPAIARLQGIAAEDDQFIAGPDLRNLCPTSDLRLCPVPVGVAVDMIDGDRAAAISESGDFPNALPHARNPERPIVSASVATCGGRIIGVAGVTADCDELWQIGVDVALEYRGRGIGAAVVSSATRAVLASGAIPYYSTSPANVASRNVALNVGYWPAWVELYARERGA